MGETRDEDAGQAEGSGYEKLYGNLIYLPIKL